jgi:hypothetical protein
MPDRNGWGRTVAKLDRDPLDGLHAEEDGLLHVLAQPALQRRESEQAMRSSLILQPGARFG